MSRQPFGYSVQEYGEMAACEPRMTTYAEALRKAVGPGSTVFDIGSGPGIFALIALRLGAARAVAIDPDPSVELAREMAQANGFGDRLEVFRGVSTEYRPEQRADVIVSDIRGNLPFLQGHVASIVDARERLLVPGGSLIPKADRIHIAAIESPQWGERISRPWRENALGLDLDAGHRFAASSANKAYFEAGDMLGPSAILATWDYSTLTDPDLSADFRISVERDGTAHGLAVWFDAELCEGVGFSNAPGAPKLIYGQLFLPFEIPVAMRVGGEIAGRFTATLAGSDYLYGWSGRITPQPGADAVRFHQSTFGARILPKGDFGRGASNRVPAPSENLTVDAFILEQVDGARSIEEIAAAAQHRFSPCLPTLEAAMLRARKVLSRYDRRENLE